MDSEIHYFIFAKNENKFLSQKKKYMYLCMFMVKAHLLSHV